MASIMYAILYIRSYISQRPFSPGQPVGEKGLCYVMLTAGGAAN